MAHKLAPRLLFRIDSCPNQWPVL